MESVLQCRNEDIPDEDLVLRFTRDDLAAFDLFVDRNSRVALGLAFRLAHDRDAAEAIVEDALLDIWRKADSYCSSRGTPRDWLIGLVRHRCVDRLHTRQ